MIIPYPDETIAPTVLPEAQNPFSYLRGFEIQIPTQNSNLSHYALKTPLYRGTFSVRLSGHRFVARKTFKKPIAVTTVQ